MRGFARYCAAAVCAGMLPHSPAQAQDAAREIDELVERVEKLEGIRAIKKLQRAFGYYVDRGLWDQAADLFADGGTIEIGMDGVYAGRERIEEYLRRLHGGQNGLIYGQLNEWITLQPAIAMAEDGESASARWRDLGMLGQYKQYAAWRDGIYENTYVKGADGIWRIGSLHLYVNFVVPYEAGWARLDEGEGLRPSEASLAFPPDRPPSAIYQPFPAVQVPPFGAPHPVTGEMVEAE